MEEVVVVVAVVVEVEGWISIEPLEAERSLRGIGFSLREPRRDLIDELLLRRSKISRMLG